MLERYDNPDDIGNMNLDTEGDWVKFSDVKALLSRVSKEFDNLAELDSPEVVSVDEKLWDEIDENL